MVTIIIINYYQKNLLHECVSSIYQHFNFPFEIIIVNNSPDENIDDIKTDRENIVILKNSNRGFSQANNFGVLNSTGETLLFLNADTKFESGIGSDAFELLNRPDTGAIGLKLYNDDGTFQLSFWKENTFFNEMENRKAENRFKKRDKEFISNLENENAGIREVDWVTGAAMMIRKDIFEKTGGFDEKFFLFYEDADLCKRLNEKGFKNLFYPFCRIIHFKGENINENFFNNTYYYSKKSQLYYYKKHNRFFERIAIRLYLFFKFFILYFTSFKKINLRISLLILGIKTK